MLAACFRSADKEDKKPEVDSESESATDNADDATSEDEATKQENKIELAKKTFEDKLRNLDSLFKNNVHLIQAEVEAPQVPYLAFITFLQILFYTPENEPT